MAPPSCDREEARAVTTITHRDATMDLPTTETAQWNLLEWAIGGMSIFVLSIVTWAGNIHFTVRRHDEEIEELKKKSEGVATKDDISAIKDDLRRLLDWALGTVRPPTEPKA